MALSSRKPTDLEVPMLKIGDFSKLSRVSIRMLRHYDEIGLLAPIRVDPDSGYRYYNEDQLPVAGRIAALKDMGFGLTAIGEMLTCHEDKEALERYLRLKQAELQELSEQTAYRLRLLNTALERLRKDDETMKYDVTLKTFPVRYAATVRMNIPAYDMEGMLWSTLVSETASLNLIRTTPATAVWCSMTKSTRSPMWMWKRRRLSRGATLTRSMSNSKHCRRSPWPPRPAKVPTNRCTRLWRLSQAG